MNNTRTVSLWIASEEPSYRHVERLADAALQDAVDGESHATTARNNAIEALALQIEEFVCESMPYVKGMWGDLIQSALDSVDFEDIARVILSDRQIYSIFSGDCEDAQLFTDEELARDRLLDMVRPESDPEGVKALRIQEMQPGSTVNIEGTEYTLGVS